MKSFYSHGKLLLTGEYLVLKGARAIAIPTKLGQHLKFQSNSSEELFWISLNKFGTPWFKGNFNIINFKITETNNMDIANKLSHILKSIRNQNPEFLIRSGGFIETNLEFDLGWGLGSSSTLISNLSKLADINPFKLLRETIGGSGYDIACANSKKPIFYSIGKDGPVIENCQFNPKFKNNLYLVYLNKKKKSSDAIKNFIKKKIKEEEIIKINELSKRIESVDKLIDFENVLLEHENFMGKILSCQPVKEKLFNDFNGVIKSLGAWGGDFVLATGKSNTKEYFKEKGYPVVLEYNRLIF